VYYVLGWGAAEQRYGTSKRYTVVVNGAKNLRFERLQFSYTDWHKVDSLKGYAGTQAGFSNDGDHKDTSALCRF